MNIIIATIKSWNIKNANRFKKNNKDKYNAFIITNKNDLTLEVVKKLNPKIIFFPHWSWIIPDDIFKNYTCVVFHMTDLPYGRGGSPLQNLIERGHKSTKISAIRVDGGIDTGDIFLKKHLDLYGTAEEIFIRASNIIFNEMIPEILEKKPLPQKQEGEVVEFKRRKPEQSEIHADFSLGKIYDYIRMLDAEGYPKAFIKFGNYRLEFSRSSLKNDRIIADVEIIVDGEENE
ncbi:formyltransferase family protein [Acetivibrio saccincola]|jgi:methionyl-tRNA formyltransferase|uniref:Methionyl-tRNA formyltransferase n=1 Tax=Acetivibrio saccincola TaxID=1677857 RepID=A0A2K9DXM2_9FIRM|nr:formyltransferase family protein [Acetivibrio saccincola]AUG56262.1 Methionyl-tRNA formyltransferase [Acetivibrio saccincola]